MSLGTEWKRRRLDLDWTQQQTAKYFGVLKDSYQKWEWNQITPHIRNRKKVIEFLEHNIWDDGSNSLANRCLFYRIEKGITRAEMSLYIDISEETIRRLEVENRASEETIKKCEELLKRELLRM